MQFGDRREGGGQKNTLRRESAKIFLLLPYSSFSVSLSIHDPSLTAEPETQEEEEEGRTKGI